LLEQQAAFFAMEIVTSPPDPRVHPSSLVQDSLETGVSLQHWLAGQQSPVGQQSAEVGTVAWSQQASEGQHELVGQQLEFVFRDGSSKSPVATE